MTRITLSDCRKIDLSLKDVSDEDLREVLKNTI